MHYCSTQLNICSVWLHTWSQWDFCYIFGSIVKHFEYVVSDQGGSAPSDVQCKHYLSLHERDGCERSLFPQCIKKQMTSPPHVQEEKVSACPQRFHHGSPHWPNIRHKVKKQSAGFSQHIRPGSSSTKSFHDTCLTWQCFLCLNSHLPHPCREGRGTRGNRLGVILQLFGPGQDGVDIWDGVILKGTSAVL